MNAKIGMRWIALASALIAGAALAQNPAGPAPAQAPQGMPGMMGPGMMGPGTTMGPGMMGPGTMHHEMMGSGMMRSGPGFGRNALRALNLSDEQRDRIARIMEETRRASWNVLGELMSERFALRDLYRADKMNIDAVLEQQRKVDDLNRQLLKTRLEAHGRIQAMLSPEQQKIFRSFPPRAMGRARG